MITGFNGKKVNKSKVPVRSSPFDKLMSIELLESFRSRNVRNKRSINKTANQIRLLRNIEPSHEIDQTMQWLCKQIRSRRQYIPLVRNGTAFRSKYDRIRACMERDLESAALPMTEEAKGIISRLRMLRWPKDSDSQLEQEVLHSLKWVRYVKKFVFGEAILQIELNNRTTSRFKELQNSFPRDWVYRYYSALHGGLCNWEEWSGKLTPFRMSGMRDQVWDDLFHGVLKDKYGKILISKLKDQINESYKA